MRIDLEKTCAGIHDIQTKLAPPEDEAPFKLAALALTFIQDVGHIHDFEDYLDSLEHVAETSRLPTFETRQEATEWLRSHANPRDALTVVIAGTRYSVACSPQAGARFLLRTPSWAELSTASPAMNRDMERSISALLSARTHSSAAESAEPIHAALLALHFIWEGKLWSDFEDYLRRISEDVPLPALRAFGTREEAEAWLHEHPRPPCFASVEISGQLYSVGYSRGSGTRVMVRAPRREELEPRDELDEE
jgi:hypothetical protein